MKYFNKFFNILFAIFLLSNSIFSVRADETFNNSVFRVAKTMGTLPEYVLNPFHVKGEFSKDFMYSFTNGDVDKEAIYCNYVVTDSPEGLYCDNVNNTGNGEHPPYQPKPKNATIWFKSWAYLDKNNPENIKLGKPGISNGKLGVMKNDAPMGYVLVGYDPERKNCKTNKCKWTPTQLPLNKVVKIDKYFKCVSTIKTGIVCKNVDGTGFGYSNTNYTTFQLQSN